MTKYSVIPKWQMTKCLGWNRCHNIIGSEEIGWLLWQIRITHILKHMPPSLTLFQSHAHIHILVCPKVEKKTEQGALWQMCLNNSGDCLVQFVKQFVRSDHCIFIIIYPFRCTLWEKVMLFTQYFEMSSEMHLSHLKCNFIWHTKLTIKIVHLYINKSFF